MSDTLSVKLQFICTSLVVQWIRLHASTVGHVGSIPGWGTKILHAVWHSQKIKNNIIIVYSNNYMFIT